MNSCPLLTEILLLKLVPNGILLGEYGSNRAVEYMGLNRIKVDVRPRTPFL